MHSFVFSPLYPVKNLITLNDNPSALLPRWSPLGDFGPHGDQNEFFGPLFFQSPHFLHFRPKNASKVGTATI